MKRAFVIAVSLLGTALLNAAAYAQTPVPAIVESPNVKVLKGLTVPNSKKRCA